MQLHGKLLSQTHTSFSPSCVFVFQARKLRKYKERRLDGYHGGPNMGENLADALNSVEVDESIPDNEQYIDPEQTVVTKVKRCVVSSHCSLNWFRPHISFLNTTECESFSFDLSNPISIKEAIFALDYIDHDFYVFRDEESNEVSVVYKRNAGGVGLIQPEQWNLGPTWVHLTMIHSVKA